MCLTRRNKPFRVPANSRGLETTVKQLVRSCFQSRIVVVVVVAVVIVFAVVVLLMLLLLLLLVVLLLLFLLLLSSFFGLFFFFFPQGNHKGLFATLRNSKFNNKLKVLSWAGLFYRLYKY